MSRIVPNLWYTDKAEEAAAFYASILPNSKVDAVLAVANKPQRARRSDRRSVIRRLTHDEARRIAGDWTGASISRQIGSYSGSDRVL